MELLGLVVIMLLYIIILYYTGGYRSGGGLVGGLTMAITGKTGADAIARSLSHICRVINAYAAKLSAVINLSETNGWITADQADVARAFVASADAACQVFKIIAKNSGFQP